MSHTIACLLVCLLFAAPRCQAVPDNEDVFQSDFDSGGNVLQLPNGTSKLAISDKVSFAYWNGPCANKNACPDFIIAALTDIKEVDESGQLVPGRDMAGLIDLPPTPQTRIDTTQYIVTANITLHLVATPPACPNGAVPAALPQGAGIAVQLYMVGVAQNVSMEGVNQKVEMMEGNLKWNVAIDAWPFCSSNNSLVLEFKMRTPGLESLDTATDIITSKELEDQLEQQELALKGESYYFYSDEYILAPAPAPAPGPQVEPISASAPEPTGTILPVSVSVNEAGTSGWATGNPGNGNRHRGNNGTEGNDGSPGNGNNGNSDSNGGNGNERKKFDDVEDAIKGRELTPEQKELLEQRFVNNRPLKGLGRRNLTNPAVFLLFPPGQMGKQVKLDVPEVAVIGGQETAVTVAYTEQSSQNGPLTGLLTITLPAFNGSAVYDPVSTISESEGDLNTIFEAALDSKIVAGAPVPAPGPPVVPSPSPSPPPSAAVGLTTWCTGWPIFGMVIGGGAAILAAVF